MHTTYLIFLRKCSHRVFGVDEEFKLDLGAYSVSALLDERGIVNENFSKPDRFTAMTGGTATIFARHQNDFIRVSTSLKKQDGNRELWALCSVLAILVIKS